MLANTYSVVRHFLSLSKLASAPELLFRAALISSISLMFQPALYAGTVNVKGIGAYLLSFKSCPALFASHKKPQAPSPKRIMWDTNGGDIFYVDGYRAELLLGSSGEYNFGIYKLIGTSPPKVVKIYRGNGGLISPSKGTLSSPNTPEYWHETALETLPNEYFADIVRGNLIASKAGGPKIFAFGPLLGSKITGELYYIEMEQMFPDSSFTFSAKNNLKRIREVYQEKTNTQLALLILKVIENKIYIMDADVLYDNSGSVRWLDGYRWIVTDRLVPLNFLLSWARVPEEKVREVLIILKELIGKSSIESPDKIKVLENIDKTLRK